MDIKAEIIRVSQRKLSSGDNQYEIVFRHENPLAMDLGKLPADTLFNVRIDIDGEEESQDGRSKNVQDSGKPSEEGEPIF